MPIWAIITITLGFVWLLCETDWMRVTLPAHQKAQPKYARYIAIHSLRDRKSCPSIFRKGNNYPPNYSPNGEPEYTIRLSPGVSDVLCGWEWVDKHVANLVDYYPIVNLAVAGVKYQMTIKHVGIVKDIMKANKLSKREKALYK